MNNPLVSGLTLAQSSLQQGIFRKIGQSALADKVDSDFMFILWVAVASFVILMTLMVYWVIKYRRKPGVAPQRSPSHNTVLEITWTVVPTIFLAIMFFRGFWVYLGQVVVPGDAIELKVKASKWNWAAEYPGGVQSLEGTRIGSQDIPIFYVPAGVPIKIRQSSADVMHAFYIPDYRVKFDVFPNRYTNIWFKAEAPSGATVFKDGPFKGQPYEDHWLFCAEYCGENHSEMAAIIRAVPPSVYDTWYINSRDGVGLSPLLMGQKLHAIRCAACHNVDGAPGGTGPSWKDLYGSKQPIIGQDDVLADDNYIRESILIPGAKIVKGYSNQMPSFQGQLNDKQIDGIIEYMKSISKTGGSTGGTVAQPADAKAADAKPAEKKN